MFRKIVILGLLLVLALYAGAEVAVNNYAEKAIARKLQQDHPEAREVKASVSLPVLFPFVSSGRIRRLGATAQNVAVATPVGLPAPTPESTIVAADVTVALEGLDVDRDALLQRRRLRVESIDQLEMTVEITEEEASKSLRLRPEFQVLAFEFLDDVSRITGAGVIGGTFVPVEGSTRLRFVPNAVGGLPEGLDPMIELGNLPFFRCTAQVEVEVVRDRVRITCAQDDPPVAD